MKILALLTFMLLSACDYGSNPSSTKGIESDLCRQTLVGDCSWYAKCLESQHPCGADAYAVGYGQKYCERFTQKSWLSPNTTKWVDKTRSCLQRAVISFLDENPKATCIEIRHAAFDSHPDCYTGSPDSFCYLDIRDISAVYFTLDLKERFKRESLVQMQAVVKQCLAVYAGRSGKVSLVNEFDDGTMEERIALFEDLLKKTSKMLGQ